MLMLSLLVIGTAAGYAFPPSGEPNKIVTPNSEEKPNVLRDVGLDQRLGEQVPLDLTFTDENGKSVRLADYFGSKPVILNMVYYSCPMLCGEVLNGLTGALQIVKFDVGREFNVLTVSIDPRDTTALAAKKQAIYVKRYGRPNAQAGWHFLTGRQDQIEALTKAVGFRYKYDAEIKQYAHAAGIMVLTPDGKVAQYFYGVEYSPKDIRLSLVEASKGKVGTVVDQLLLFCYHYDPATGKYGAAVMNLLRLGGGMTILGIVLLVGLLRRQELAHSS